MTNYPNTIILGSKSPRRLELLQQLFPNASIEVVPPSNPEEPSFEDLCQWAAIEDLLASVARGKSNSVLAQLLRRDDIIARQATVICADTIIVVPLGNELFTVLEQPAENDNWKEIVGQWFHDYYFDKSHFALTALCVDFPDGKRSEAIVKTKVTFDSAGEEWLEWYLDTEESRGKAGGYGLQGAGSVFISSVEGSLSNVIGLPQRKLLQLLKR